MPLFSSASRRNNRSNLYGRYAPTSVPGKAGTSNLPVRPSTPYPPPTRAAAAPQQRGQGAQWASYLASHGEQTQSPPWSAQSLSTALQNNTNPFRVSDSQNPDKPWLWDNPPPIAGTGTHFPAKPLPPIPPQPGSLYQRSPFDDPAINKESRDWAAALRAALARGTSVDFLFGRGGPGGGGSLVAKQYLSQFNSLPDALKQVLIGEFSELGDLNKYMEEWQDPTQWNIGPSIEERRKAYYSDTPMVWSNPSGGTRADSGRWVPASEDPKAAREVYRTNRNPFQGVGFAPGLYEGNLEGGYQQLLNEFGGSEASRQALQSLFPQLEATYSQHTGGGIDDPYADWMEFLSAQDLGQLLADLPSWQRGSNPGRFMGQGRNVLV